MLGTFDTTLLWTNLGVSLLVLVLPAYFDLSLQKALLATLVGGLVGNGMLAVAGLIGADGRVPTMVLQRAPLGRRGSYLATALNVLQCLGWSIFELIVIATAAGLLCDRLLGFRATWLWTILFGVTAAALAVMGPIGFVRRFVRKFAVWAVVASLVYLTWWILHGASLHRLWTHPGTHHGSFWLAVDTVVAVTVSWAPLVADYTRFSRDRRSAFWGAGVGYLLPTLFQFGFGSILVLSRHVDAAHPELILTAIAGGGAAAALVLAVSAVATGGALAINLRSYSQFLYLLGAFFVPLLGVLVADWLAAGAHYTEDDVFGAPPLRPGPIAAWIAGFAVYEWLAQPAGLGFWTRLLAHLPTPSYAVGASLPSFVCAFILASAAARLARLGSPRATDRGSREPLPRSR